jgi:long-chain fatty acid transport protein
MKRSINIIIAVMISLSGTSAFAINGDLLIGVGAKSRGMGGLGIAKSHGAESGLVNPAMLTGISDTEISITSTFFMPVAYYDGGAGEEYSTSDMTLIPELSLATKIDDNFYLGFGIWVTGGLGADYSKSGTVANGGNGTMQMLTKLGLVKFGVPLAYKTDGLSVGVTPILQYGVLDIHFNNGVNSVGDGEGKDIGFGYNFGLSYDLAYVGLENVLVGAVYKSSIKMNYNGQISAATEAFSTLLGGAMSDSLEQPAEIGVGVSYKFLNKHTIAFDYKHIQWEDAEGYSDFGWKNQNIYIFGYEYAEDTWALRAGYNYAKSPLREQDGSKPAGATLNMFNLLGFPVNIESHYTVGGTYYFNDKISVDAAFVYADEQSNTYDTSYLYANSLSAADEVSVRHSQMSLSLQLNYNF